MDGRGIEVAVQLSASYLRRSFQLLAQVSSNGVSAEAGFERAADLVYAWGWRKYVKIFRDMPEEKATFDENQNANELGVLYDREAGRFFFRAAHSDTQVPGRIWITDVELLRRETSCVMGVRLSVSSLHSCTEEVPFSRPGFIRDMAEQLGLRDVRRLTGRVQQVSSPEEVEDLIALLEHPDRRLPVVVLTPCGQQEDARWKDYMLDGGEMAEDLLAVAHVVLLSREANEALTARVGRQWSAFNGSVRTYYPGLSFEETDCYHHPMLTQRAIRMRDTVDSEDPKFCLHEVEGYVQRYVLSRRMPWETYGMEFYLAARQDALRRQRAAGRQSRQELIRSYEGQLGQLQKQCEENLSLADSYAGDCQALEEENDRQRQLIGQLKAQLDALRFQLQTATGGDGSGDVPEGGTYGQIAEWISQYFPDRLYLHPRAERSLKSACYENVALVYRCLKLLAVSYYDFCIGQISYDEFMQACHQVDPGLDERGAITDIGAGRQGETYYVQYQGRRRKLERHLAKGTSMDPRYCLRIYYFWDEQNQMVVIGDLPRHLDTSFT